jgi:hypothetical protein
MYNNHDVLFLAYTGQIKIWDMSTFKTGHLLKKIMGLKKPKNDE